MSIVFLFTWGELASIVISRRASLPPPNDIIAYSVFLIYWFNVFLIFFTPIVIRLYNAWQIGLILVYLIFNFRRSLFGNILPSSVPLLLLNVKVIIFSWILVWNFICILEVILPCFLWRYNFWIIHVYLIYSVICFSSKKVLCLSIYPLSDLNICFPNSLYVWKSPASCLLIRVSSFASIGTLYSMSPALSAFALMLPWV